MTREWSSQRFSTLLHAYLRAVLQKIQSNTQIFQFLGEKSVDLVFAYDIYHYQSILQSYQDFIFQPPSFLNISIAQQKQYIQQVKQSLLTSSSNYNLFKYFEWVIFHLMKKKSFVWLTWCHYDDMQVSCANWGWLDRLVQLMVVILQSDNSYLLHTDSRQLIYFTSKMTRHVVSVCYPLIGLD